MLILFKICTVGLHSVFCIYSLASGRVACGLFVITFADLWINTVQLQHDVGRSFWRRHWTMRMRVVLIDVCSIGIVNRYVCQLNFAFAERVLSLISQRERWHERSQTVPDCETDGNTRGVGRGREG